MKITPACFVLSLCTCVSACTFSQPPNKKIAIADSSYTYANATVDGTGKFYKGREISHIMGAGGGDWLERDTRAKEEDTRQAIKNIVADSNAVIADIGAGTGYYSFKLAAKVPKGKVFAVELQDEFIQFLTKRKKQLKDTVVTVIKGTETDPHLPENTVDLAIMVDVYHELAYPQEVLQALQKALKPTGKILLLEYRGEDPAVPIKALHKTTVEQLNKEFSANGFTLFYKGDFLPIQHFLLYEKMK